MAKPGEGDCLDCQWDVDGTCTHPNLSPESELGGCPEYEPCPPLVVDALAEALYWLLNLHHGVSKGGNDPETGQPYPVTDEEWKAALEQGMRVYARYQEEVGDES